MLPTWYSSMGLRLLRIDLAGINSHSLVVVHRLSFRFSTDWLFCRYRGGGRNSEVGGANDIFFNFWRAKTVFREILLREKGIFWKFAKVEGAHPSPPRFRRLCVGTYVRLWLISFSRIHCPRRIVSKNCFCFPYPFFEGGLQGWHLPVVEEVGDTLLWFLIYSSFCIECFCCIMKETQQVYWHFNRVWNNRVNGLVRNNSLSMIRSENMKNSRV